MGNSNHSVGIEIKAGVQGKESVVDLTRRLDEMSKVLEGDLKEQAQQAAAKLRELAQQDEVVQTFERIGRQVKDTGIALKAAEKEAADFQKQISAAGPATAQEAAAMERLETTARGLRDTLQQQKVALAGATSELQRNGIAATSTKAAQQRLAAEMAQVRESVNGLAPAYQAAASRGSAAGDTLVRTHRAVGEGVESISTQLQRVQSAYLGLQGGGVLGGMLKDVAATADAYSGLAARIKLASGEGKGFETAMEGVQQIAVATRSDLEATGILFTKVLEAGKAQGLSQQQALSLTQTINQAIQITGGSAEAAKAAITQLTQGLESGVIRGDEFNSVMEQAPRLAKAMADGLGVTKGQLREMAEAGQLSAETVMRALRLQSDTVQAEFNKIPPTIGGALQNLSTAWTVYIGNTDQASGSSRVAAEAIGFLAKNLSTIAGYLMDAGQAGAAFIALRLAQQFLGLGQAAKVAAVEVTATAAALRTAEAASTAAGAGVGRFAGLLAGLKTFTLLGIVTNFQDIGKWIGESTAKLMGYKDRTLELAQAEAVQARIAKDRQELRQRDLDLQKQQISAQFGLDASANKLIAKFDELRKGGDSAAEAIGKIGKDFDLSTAPGIKNASAVLDRLLADGKLTAEQFKEVWVRALDGKDLLQFETMAKAALDGTARSAEQTAQVMEAVLGEAVKRTGLDMDLISGGMSKASVSALNDVESIVRGLDRLQDKGIDTATVLTTSLGKAVSTADSQKAIDAVIARVESLRSKLGEKVADGLLDQARQKARALNEELDKARPGINSTAEAMRALGVTSQKSLEETATKFKSAYDLMRGEGVATTRELRDAFQRYAEAAIQANGGVATEALKTEAAMRGIRITTDEAGQSVVSSMSGAENATRRVGDAAATAAAKFTSMASAARSAATAASGINASKPSAPEFNDKGQRIGSITGNYSLNAQFELWGKLMNGTLTADDLPAAQNALRVSRENARLGGPGSVSLEGRADDEAWISRMTQIVARAGDLKARQEGRITDDPRADYQRELAALRNQDGTKTTPAPSPAPTLLPVNIHLPGFSTQIHVADASEARALQNLLAQLSEAASRTGP